MLLEDSAQAWNDSTIHNDLSVKIEVNASTLSVDATGTLGVLAARKGLYVIDLESPYQPSRTLHHQTKWDVTVVKCNPHVPYKGVVASTSNHNTLLWNIDHSSSVNGFPGILASHQPLMATLRAHTRPVSDVAWSPSEPTILATCSADTKTHLWDIRTPQKPVQTLCAFTTSATQVEWNKLDPTTLATAHDGEVRVWDTRSCDKPTAIITAHMQKIYGLDWSPNNMHELVTCSEDKQIKFWDVTQPRVCQGCLVTGAPVWRARYTPFGDGLVTTSHRQDNIIRLWSLNHESNQIEPKLVHDFVGHRDLVKGFAWRSHEHTFQLISWSKNQELRMWRMDKAHLEACGLTTSKTLMTTEPEVNRRSEASHPVFKFDLASLKSDFVVNDLPKVSVSFQWNPQNILSLVDDEGEREDAAVLENKKEKEADITNTTKSPEVAQDLKAENAIPYPFYGGARFSGPNVLVMFNSKGVIAADKVASNGKSAQLPRTYVGAVKFTDGIVGLNNIAPNEKDSSWQSDVLNSMIVNDDNAPDNNPAFQNPDAAPPSSMIMPDYNAALSVKILLFDCSGFCGEFGLPLIKCADQAAQAAIAGHMELSQMWSMLAISSQNDEPPETLMAPWSAHPLGASLVQHVLELYEKAGDVSMLAAIVCALDGDEETEANPPDAITLVRPRTLSDPFEFDQKPIRKATSTGSQLQNLPTIASPRADRPHARTSSTDMALMRNVLPRSPVLSATNYSFIDEEGEAPPPPLPAPTREDVVLLSSKPKDRERYDEYKHAYADVLYHYGALNTRCEMLKHLTTRPPPHEGLTLALHCHTCGHPTSELYCAQCKDFSIKCSVCELVVRGESMFCINCGHGGHRAHLAQWFETENACPTGCGCWCNQPTIPASSMPITPTSMMRANSY